MKINIDDPFFWNMRYCILITITSFCTKVSGIPEIIAETAI